MNKNSENDMFRTNMLTQFRCTECGTLLTITSDNPTPSDPRAVGSSGCDNIKITLYVHPCPKCKEKHESIINAIGILRKVAVTTDGGTNG